MLLKNTSYGAISVVGASSWTVATSGMVATSGIVAASGNDSYFCDGSHVLELTDRQPNQVLVLGPLLGRFPFLVWLPLLEWLPLLGTMATSGMGARSYN